jgi:hypothetical protein
VNFTFSALLGPLFAGILQRVSGGAATMSLEHYSLGFAPLLFGVLTAIGLSLLLSETGPAVQRASLHAGSQTNHSRS